MPTKLLFSFLFISLLVGAQTTHQLGWGNTGSDANQRLTINVGDTVCIIEAMKLFNEIESEVSGTIVKVLIDDSSPVEFDQPLFLVDPS